MMTMRIASRAKAASRSMNAARGSITSSDAVATGTGSPRRRDRRIERLLRRRQALRVGHDGDGPRVRQEAMAPGCRRRR